MAGHEGGPFSVGEMWKRCEIQVPPAFAALYGPSSSVQKPIAGQQVTVNEFNEVIMPNPSQPTQNPTREGWQTVAKCYAEVKPLSGRELWMAQQIRPDITTRVTIRYRRDMALSPRMRFFVTADNRALNVEYRLPQQKKRWWQALCKEEVL